jgi:hypothetical protein
MPNVKLAIYLPCPERLHISYLACLAPESTIGIPKRCHRVRWQLSQVLCAGDCCPSGETLAMVDLSLMVKSGVQYSLFGGSVLNLGTEGHRRKWVTHSATHQLAVQTCAIMILVDPTFNAWHPWLELGRSHLHVPAAISFCG